MAHQVRGWHGWKVHTHPHDEKHVSDGQVEVCGGGRVLQSTPTAVGSSPPGAWLCRGHGGAGKR